jgi:hypothetical protein
LTGGGEKMRSSSPRYQQTDGGFSPRMYEEQQASRGPISVRMQFFKKKKKQKKKKQKKKTQHNKNRYSSNHNVGLWEYFHSSGCCGNATFPNKEGQIFF